MKRLIVDLSALARVLEQDPRHATSTPYSTYDCLDLQRQLSC